MSKPAYVSWTEIPVKDLKAAQKFYEAVFTWHMVYQKMEPNDIVNFSNDDQAVSGHLYEGKPAIDGSGPTIHLVVPDQLEATIERCQNAGGKVLSPAIEIPPGRFVYATDPDGNSLGLFEGRPA